MELMDAIGTGRSMRVCPICPRSILRGPCEDESSPYYGELLPGLEEKGV